MRILENQSQIWYTSTIILAFSSCGSEEIASMAHWTGSKTIVNILAFFKGDNRTTSISFGNEKIVLNRFSESAVIQPANSPPPTTFSLDCSHTNPTIRPKVYHQPPTAGSSHPYSRRIRDAQPQVSKPSRSPGIVIHLDHISENTPVVNIIKANLAYFQLSCPMR